MNTALKLMHPSKHVSKDSALFRPPTFPPPDDWPVSVNTEGTHLSFFKDDYWDMHAFGFYGFNFNRSSLSEENKRLLKRAMVLIIYHPRLFPGKLSSCQPYFQTLCRLAEFCETQQILISHLYRFPHLFTKAAEHIQCARILDRISQLHKLNLYCEELGFVIGGKRFLQVMSRERRSVEAVQYPYIPPRLWNYQVTRLNEALDDFIKHRELFEKAFMWLHHAYSHNRGRVASKYLSPFHDHDLYKKRRVLYPGNFEKFLEDFGLLDLFNKWLEPGVRKVPRFSTLSISKYLSLIRDVAIIFILTFSMQRKSEATSLRSDCFEIEHDKNLGNICTIRGETTKTDPDSDARWVVPETVKKAVDAASWIAKLRLNMLAKEFNVPRDIKENPYLLSPACELWSTFSGRKMTEKDCHRLLKSFKRILDYSNLMRRGSKLFEDNEIQISEEDARIALSLTPNLEKKAWFGIGKPWKFTTHQSRRTLAVNMFASSNISVASIQHQMKHFTRNMTLYYGRNYANISLNSKVQRTLIAESHSNIYRQLIEIASNDIDHVRPHNTSRSIDSLINIIDASEEQKLQRLIKAGEVGCRKTLLGFCMTKGSCEYGGVESISKCAGGDGRGICAEAIFSRKNKDALIRLKKDYEIEMANLSEDSIRRNALKLETYAIEVYLNVVDK